MAPRSAPKRIRTPLMEAFRAAHRERDARLHVDLRDEAGERVIAGRRASARSAVGVGDLQRSVALDLERLLNAINFAAAIDLDGLPHVARSIVNHGFIDIARLSFDDLSVNDLAAEIERTLRTFEPRLVPRSVSAKRDDTLDAAGLKLRFLVRAEIQAEPLNVPVEFIADLERDTGRVRVAQR